MPMGVVTTALTRMPRSTSSAERFAALLTASMRVGRWCPVMTAPLFINRSDRTPLADAVQVRRGRAAQALAPGAKRRTAACLA
jgi:hypothetical protein